MLSAATIALVALTFDGRASAVDTPSVVSLLDEICLAHGGDLPAIEAMALVRNWRPLSVAELEPLRLSDPIGHATGWALRDGEDPTFLVISLPMHNLTPSMRRRLERGDPVRRPPERSVSMYPPGWTPPASASMQFCQLYFRDADVSRVVDGVRALEFQGEPFGADPSVSRSGGETRTDEPSEDGGRSWTWSKYGRPSWQVWQIIVFDAAAPGGGELSSIRVHQPWNESVSQPT
jgi:hypothetical protein